MAAIKSPQHYLDIVADNKAILPELSAELERLLGPYRNATDYKNRQKNIFDIKRHEHEVMIFLTVLSVLLPVCTMMLLAMYEVAANERDYIGDSTCGADLNSLRSWAYDMHKRRITRQHDKGYVKVAHQQIPNNDEDTHETEQTKLREGRSHSLDMA